MAKYISDNLQSIVNKCLRSGITGALDWVMQEDDKADNQVEEETDSELDSVCDESED